MAATTQGRLSEAQRLIIRRWVLKTLGYAFLVAFSIIFLIPFLWMVFTSVKAPWDAVSYPPSLFPDPTKLSMINFEYVGRTFPFYFGFRNTMLIVVGVEVGRLISASLVAYSFARLRFRFKTPIFLAVLSTMMLPYHVTMVPQYLMFKELGWIDTFYPLIVPAFLGGGAFYVFLLRQFFQTIPLEYDDSARIDGAGVLAIFWYIILPMSVPALGVVAIFTFIGEWNDFFAPIIYLNSTENKTLAIHLLDWQRLVHIGGTRRDRTWSSIMTASMLLTLPPLVVFFVAQRYFIQGIVISGVKG
jgi:ABC-type glycerol-3-phosphate transport system permease component